MNSHAPNDPSLAKRPSRGPEPDLDASIGPRPRLASLLLSGLFVTIAALVAMDLIVDRRSGVTLSHLATELAVVLLALVGAAALWRDVLVSRREAQSALRDVEGARAEAARWREEAREALSGLSLAMDGQFDRWALTPAEREVALFLLNGLGLRAIATARGTSERTARKQALSIYSKSGLGGRAELAAFFLEDLLIGKVPPTRDADDATGGASEAP